MERIAVIGLGNISIRHRHNLKYLYPFASIYAMSASGQVAVSEVSDCDVFVSSVEELIQHRIELAIVASPATLHAVHAIPLIEAGIPVLIEKPLAVSLADCEAIQTASREHNTPVAVGYCLRYLPSALIMKELLDEQKVGRCYYAHVEIGQYLPDWRPNKDYRHSVSASAELGGGVLLELSHEFDYIQWLLGPLLVKYANLCSSEELALSVEDMADIILSSTTGTITSVHLDFLQRKAHRKCRVIGSEGTLEWDLIQNSVSLSSAKGVEIIYCEPDWDKNEIYLIMMTDFVNLIQGTTSHCVSIEDATQTVALIEKIKAQYHHR
ncbi:TPA: Gfo/Idh/MocA family oxidoreductase [Aeromonas hydrophila]|uniref:Gfo/Idh/MocA family protein n=1 Tax=Aeromonas hydrophila TaxID=644 RepID=UPI000C331A1A|nr:Gfo/Idh/MocA family oxidoreductase [Aeromonas hydrophila]PKD26444.1 oxidoreductase domain-containing protein [Aeromonas hydrophila]WRK89993.1 Gfo/Idh/MocA family oxidoreductase [Aeromonas hydrophila]HAT2712714.1 Gfo/Idh/MocA family oxidoreductase [Aeromonas hydrophila]